MTAQKLVPIFDNLNYMANPFRQGFNVSEPTLALTTIPANALNADALCCAQFLYTYRGSLDTFASYRREIERFVQWCWFVEGLCLSEVRRQHIEAFVHFCQAPPLSWIGVKSVQRFQNGDGLRIANPAWRPLWSRSVNATIDSAPTQIQSSMTSVNRPSRPYFRCSAPSLII